MLNLFERCSSIYLSRRSFLAGMAGGLLTLSFAGFNPALSQPGPPDIGLARGDPDPATRSAVGLLGGMGSFVREGQHVLIKPNMSFSSPPESATNTHPGVVEALVRMCLEAGASRVTVSDHTLQEAEASMRRSGIGRLGEEIRGCNIQAPSSSHYYQRTDIARGERLQSSRILKEALQADVLIAAPVAKHHSSTGVSLSMKGMLGLILDRGELHWKYDLNTAIVDLCTKLWADLTVVDATRALTTEGPSGPGEVIRPNTVIASRDMVAADAQAVSMIPWYGRSMDPGQVEHVRLAHERGLGRMDVEQLRTESASL